MAWERLTTSTEASESKPTRYDILSSGPQFTSMATLPDCPEFVHADATPSDNNGVNEGGFARVQSNGSTGSKKQRMVGGVTNEASAITQAGSTDGSSHGKRRATVEGQAAHGHLPSFEKMPSDGSRRATIEGERVRVPPTSKGLIETDREEGPLPVVHDARGSKVQLEIKSKLVTSNSNPDMNSGSKINFWKLITTKSENLGRSESSGSSNAHAIRNAWRNAVSGAFSRSGSQKTITGSGVFRMVQMATRIGHFGRVAGEEEGPALSEEETWRLAQRERTTQNLQQVMRRVAEHSRADLSTFVASNDLDSHEASPAGSPPLSPLLRLPASHSSALERELRNLDSDLRRGASRRSSAASAQPSAPRSPLASPDAPPGGGGGSVDSEWGRRGGHAGAAGAGEQGGEEQGGQWSAGKEGGSPLAAAVRGTQRRLSSFFSSKRRSAPRADAELSGSSETTPRAAPDASPLLRGAGVSKRGSWSNLSGLRRKSSESLRSESGRLSRRGSASGQSFVGMNFIVRNQQKIRRLRKKAQEVLQKMPPWATKELLSSTQQRLKAFNSSWSRLSALRGQNAVSQTEQETWGILINSEVLGGTDDAEKVERKLFDALNRRKARYVEQHSKEAADRAAIEEASMLVPGPVGDIALHQCFLLGQFEIGMKVCEHFYHRDELLNTPYGSDLKVWLDTDILAVADDDGGLYTGQTILHIAVVNGSVDLNRWLLLRRAANLVARATGAFFKPKRRAVLHSASARPDADSPRRTLRSISLHRLRLHAQYLLAWIQGRDLHHSGHKIKYQENPFSACYYGEFPLSFAASLGRVEICEVILEAFEKRRRKADPHLQQFYEKSALRKTREGQEMAGALEAWEKGGKTEVHPAHLKLLEYNYLVNAQDGEGNSAMHMAVMHDKKDTVGWLLDNGAERSLEMVNAEGLTPLTMAVRLGRTKLFHFLLQHTRQQIWQFGHVAMTKTSLVQIDTYRIPNHPLHMLPRWRSCLEIITVYEVVEFARDEAFLKLIMDKWEKFARGIYLWQYILPYLLFLGVTSTVLYLRCYVQKEELTGLRMGRPEAEARLEWGFLEFVQHNWEWRGRSGGPRFTGSVLQVCACAVVLPTLLRNGWRSRRLRRLDLDPQEAGGVVHTRQVMQFLYKNIQFLLSIGIFVSGIVATVAGLLHRPPFAKMELQALAIQSMLQWSGLLVMVMPFKFFGVLVITTWTMLTDDVFKFLVTYLTLVAAFSQSIFALTQMADSEDRILKLDQQWGNSFMKLIWVSLSDTRNILEVLSEVNQPGLTLTIYIVYLCLVSVLMTNLLIAMMNKTFKEYMAASHIAWIFPFAHLVLRIERSMPQALRDLHRLGARSGVLVKSAQQASELDIYYDIQCTPSPPTHRAGMAVSDACVGSVVEAETTNKALKKQQQLAKETFLLDAVREGMLGPFKELCESLTELTRSVRASAEEAREEGLRTASLRRGLGRPPGGGEREAGASFGGGGVSDEAWAARMQELQAANGVRWEPREALPVLDSAQLARDIALDSTINLSKLALPAPTDSAAREQLDLHLFDSQARLTNSASTSASSQPHDPADGPPSSLPASLPASLPGMVDSDPPPSHTAPPAPPSGAPLHSVAIAPGVPVS